MVGASKKAMDDALPSLPDLMVGDLAEALGEGGVVLASNRCMPTGELQAALKPGHHLIDVTGWGDLANGEIDYEGICW